LGRYPPNRQLRQLREQRYSQEELAHQVGVSALTIRRWEAGVQRPQPYHIRRLCSALSCSPDEVGYPVNRREFLKKSAVGSAAFFVPTAGVFGFEATGGSLDDRLLDDLESETKSQARLVHSLAPQQALTLVHAHLSHLGEQLATQPAGSLRRRLRMLSAETSILAGALAFRLEDRAGAGGYYSWAAELAREMDEGPLLAFALGSWSSLHSRVPRGGRGGDAALSIALLDSACRAAGTQASPYLRGWLRVCRAEEHALAGDGRASDQDVDDAITVLASAPGQDDGFFAHWTDWQSRVAGYRGSCAQLLGRRRQAAEILAGALRNTPKSLIYPRTSVAIDLAAAHAQLRDIEQSCALLCNSLSEAERAGLTVSIERIRGVRARSLEPAAKHPAVRRLDELLAS
jgi:transcriptional regulator with XRE-family HTH domain